jgi:replicative DNA helicase Mcm
VTLGDGSELPIRDLVESNLDDPKPVDDGVWDEVDFEVPSMADDGSLKTQRATKVWKREAPERLYRIQTESGREVDVTPSHPLFVGRDGGAKPVVAEDLAEGQFVAVPRSLPTMGDDSLALSIRRSRANNAVRLDVPERLTPWLGRLLGFVIAEGHVQCHDGGSATTYVTNEDREILDDVTAGLERLGLNPSERSPHDGKVGGTACSERDTAGDATGQTRVPPRLRRRGVHSLTEAA